MPRKSKPSVKASLAGSVLSGAEKAKKSGAKVASKAAKVLDAEARELEIKAKKSGAKLASKAARGLQATAKELEAGTKKATSTSRGATRKAGSSSRKPTTKGKTTTKARSAKK
ncbi:MAG: hypothetical protein ABSB24_08465 [Gaiellaceae bacterium]|jgi:hypothetical protein